MKRPLEVGLVRPSDAGIAPAPSHSYRPERESHVPGAPYIMDDPAPSLLGPPKP